MLDYTFQVYFRLLSPPHYSKSEQGAWGTMKQMKQGN